MKFFKSIRWRLQIWYGVVLAVLLAGFAFTAYQLDRSQQLRGIDDQLHQRAAVLVDACRPPPHFGPPPPGLRRDFPPEQPGPEFQGNGSNPPPDREHERERRLPFRLPANSAELFDEGSSNGFYYVVWRRDGSEMTRSTNAPIDVPSPAPSGRASGPPRMRDMFREVFVVAPPGETVLAGKSIAAEMSDLGVVAWKLSGIGGVILLLGLAGGWILATRFIRPIEDISIAAAKIAAGDLSQRIESGDDETELGALADVLNSTFAQLDAAFKEQKRFTADAAHELRTPISVILTLAQTTMTRERTVAEYQETIESCERAAQRMRRLTESLLELARFDSGHGLAKNVTFDLSESVRECVELLRPMSVEKEVEILCQLPPVSCAGDPSRIGQVIVNLVANAIQYSKRNSRVHIVTQWQSGTAILKVVDNGIGIKEEDLPHIYQRFYRGDKSRASGSGQGGLGLAISKTIVDAHGGRIDVSTQPEIGSTFTVYLPSPQ